MPTQKDYLVTPSGSQTLTNKGIDADSNLVQNLEVGNLKTTSVSTAIPVTGAVDTKLATEKAVADVINSIRPIVLSDGTLVFGGCIPIYTYAELVAALARTNTEPLVIMQDLTATSTIETSASNTIDLNGHNITGDNSFPFLNIRDGATTLRGNGTISGFYADCGACVSIWGGVFTMDGGTITGCAVTSFGGAIIVYRWGAFVMNNGAIMNSSATDGGGVWSYGTFTMTGGSITGCSVWRNGGGVYLQNDGSSRFNWTGGRVTGNTPDNVYPARDPPTEA